MDLSTEQRGIAALIAGREVEVPDDEGGYFASLRNSPELARLREIVLWWRSFAVERYCPLTAAALKQVGTFDAAVEEFVRSRDSSAFIDEVGIAFLDHVARADGDPMVVDVARFERALIKVRHGDPAVYEFEWSLDPRTILPHLVDGSPITKEDTGGRFLVSVSGQWPHLFTVAELSSSA
jgi:hypothetical protein